MVRDAIQRNPPPVYRNRRPKIYYATQVGTQPPTIVLFCNNPKAISKPYQRYLLNAFRDELSFEEVPIKLYLRKREKSDVRNDLGTDNLGNDQSSSHVVPAEEATS